MDLPMRDSCLCFTRPYILYREDLCARVYVYMCICVYVCVCVKERKRQREIGFQENLFCDRGYCAFQETT